MVSRVLQRFAFPRERWYFVLTKKKKSNAIPCNVLHWPRVRRNYVFTYPRNVRVSFSFVIARIKTLCVQKLGFQRR